MDSIRSICASIDIEPNTLSVIRHFFGYWQRRVPTTLVGAPNHLSVQEQIQALRGRFFNLNSIRVGSDNFLAADDDEIDQALHLTRAVFAKAGLGIGRIQHYDITAAQANGLDTLTSNADAEQLTADWTVDNDGQDLFYVLSWTAGPSSQTLGRSNIEGPCDKNDDSDGQTGSVVAMVSSRQETGHTTAHELGHYLGLSHRNSDATNLMAQTSAVNNLGGTINTATIIDRGQRGDIRDHCSVKVGI